MKQDWNNDTFCLCECVNVGNPNTIFWLIRSILYNLKIREKETKVPCKVSDD